MIRCLLFGLLAALSLQGRAQETCFIYLQSANQLPFYVKLNDKVWSSSPGGFLILPNLIPAAYQLALGMGEPTRENRFRIEIKGADRGFEVAPSPEGLNLVELTGSQRLLPLPDPVLSNIRYEARDDAFTRLLSLAAADTSLLRAPVLITPDLASAKKESSVPANPVPALQAADSAKSEILTPVEAPGDTVAVVKPAPAVELMLPPPARDTVVALPSDNVKEDTARQVVTQPANEAFVRSQVRRYAESSTMEGFGLVYLDKEGDRTDTIRLLIPNPRLAYTLPEKKEEKEEGLFLEVGRDSLARLNAGAKEKKASRRCKEEADASDLFRLRTRMSLRSADEAMVEEAQKAFRQRCFTSEQVRSLSALFLTAAGKYLFFEAAYGRVSDPEAFGQLEEELKDAHYRSRFKTLIGQ
jgi:hypothetical protein